MLKAFGITIAALVAGVGGAVLLVSSRGQMESDPATALSPASSAGALATGRAFSEPDPVPLTAPETVARLSNADAAQADPARRATTQTAAPVTDLATTPSQADVSPEASDAGGAPASQEAAGLALFAPEAGHIPRDQPDFDPWSTGVYR